jgi:phage-related protein (TIGR01555 family)
MKAKAKQQPAKPRIRVPSTITADGLQNVVANIGTGRDKRSHSHFTLGAGSFVFHPELEAAYQDSWIARKIVDIPAEDATREWRTFKGEHAQAIAQEEKRLGIQQQIQDLISFSRLYGGAVLLMITGQPLDRPLNVDAIQKGGLKRLVVLDRWDLSCLNINYTNPTEPSYLLPEYYSVVGGSSLIHHSHIVRMEGERLPRRLKQLEDGWGDSTLRKALEDLRDTVAAKGGIASMILEANVDTITRDGLSDELASGADEAILHRYRLFGMMKSIVNVALLDGSEKYDRKTLTFSGLSDVLDKFMVWVSGAADIPVTRFFGTSAQGLNATGEGDLKNYYDSVRSRQESEYRGAIEILDQVLIRSALGSYPDDLEFEWNPLYQESGLEQAQQELAMSQSESARIDSGVLRPSHVMKRLAAEGKYDITEEEINAQIESEKADRDGAFGPGEFDIEEEAETGEADRAEQEG